MTSISAACARRLSIRFPARFTRGTARRGAPSRWVTVGIAIAIKNADEGQREAMLKIMQGEETEPMTTMWSVFTTMCTKILEPLSKPIELEIDVDERIGRAVVPGVFEMTGEPIRNPVTDRPHRARIDLPHGFEYSLAEIGSGTTKATGKIRFDLKKTYAQFANIHLSNKGVVRKAA